MKPHFELLGSMNISHRKVKSMGGRGGTGFLQAVSWGQRPLWLGIFLKGLAKVSTVKLLLAPCLI